jgi:cytochrome P450
MVGRHAARDRREVSPAERERLRGSMNEMQDYFERAISERRQNPRGDLISALVRPRRERAMH